MIRWILAVLFLSLSTIANAASPVVFQITDLSLSNGWKVTGTITTDGSTGYLSPANIIDWNLKLVQTTDMVWTEKDSNDLNISGVSSDGKKIYVSTSPDGMSDGGALFVGRGGGIGQIATNAVIADFTQLSFNLGYGYGGIAGWQDEIGGLNFVGLNQQDNTRYVAASSLPASAAPLGKPNVFAINVPTLATNPILMTMFGTITTDGTIGPLLPANIVAWRITARNQDISYMTKLNSRVLALTGVSSDGRAIKIDHAAGQMLIGVGGRRPTFVTIADFTDPNYPDGFANYYIGWLGVVGDKFPLVGSAAQYYTAAVSKKFF